MVLSIILAVFDRKEGVVISLTLSAVTVLMYVGLLTSGKRGGKIQC